MNCIKWCWNWILVIDVERKKERKTEKRNQTNEGFWVTRTNSSNRWTACIRYSRSCYRLNGCKKGREYEESHRYYQYNTLNKFISTNTQFSRATCSIIKSTIWCLAIITELLENRITTRKWLTRHYVSLTLRVDVMTLSSWWIITILTLVTSIVAQFLRQPIDIIFITTVLFPLYCNISSNG